MRSRLLKIATVAVGATAGLVLAAGTAWAASGGGYNQDQQDCPWNASAWNTPPNTVAPGCHSVKVNVESGGMNNHGDPNSDNTRFAELGIDQLPHDPHNPSFGMVDNIGDPGTPDSPHSGCLAANTDGTKGGPNVGCGDNPSGLGFSSTFDYYALYCPLAALLPVASTPTVSRLPALYKCSPNQPIGKNAINPDLGSQSALDTILTKGVLVYLGANDNLDNGEHDGYSGLDNSDGAINGPSDGGASLLSVTPQNASNAPTASHPEGLVNYSLGFCADSICVAGSTQQQSVYQGCGATNPQNNNADDQCATPTPAPDDNVYFNNSPASTKQRADCNSGDAQSEAACHTNQDGSNNPQGANGYRQHTPQNMNVEPGVQTYQDPDPQRSPALPFGLPGVYAGTCGVYVNDSGGDGSPGVTGLNPGYLGGVSNC